MAILLAGTITSFVISFLIVPVIIKYSFRKNLVDVPGRRKIHKKITPSLGGIAIFCGFCFSSLIWIDLQNWKDIKFILVSLFIIFFIGVRDDLVPLKALLKLMGQLMAVCLLMFLFDLRVKSFYGLFGVYELPLIISYIITIFTIIIVTNSFNLIDGLDGLAGTIGTISLLAFGIWFFLIGDQIFATLAFAMAGSILAFLIFNWEPSEIFMGDTGALVIGLMLSIMTIHFINANHDLSAGEAYKFTASISSACAFIIIPLMDTLRIIILRLKKRQSPLSPDKSHIHHAILRLGMSHSQTTIILGSTHLGYILLALLFIDVQEKYLFPGLIALSIVLSVILDWMILGKLSKKGVEE